MKKLALLGLVGLALAGCQSTSVSMSEISSPAVVNQLASKNSWSTKVVSDPFDGNIMVHSVNNKIGPGKFFVRQTESWQEVYFTNGDGYIWGDLADYPSINVRVLIDGNEIRTNKITGTAGNTISTSRDAVFLGPDAKFWVPKLAQGNEMIIRTTDYCGERVTMKFDISGWPKTDTLDSNPKIAKDRFIASNGNLKITKAMCSFAKNINYAEGTSVLKAQWLYGKSWDSVSKENRLELRNSLGLGDWVNVTAGGYYLEDANTRYHAHFNRAKKFCPSI